MRSSERIRDIIFELFGIAALLYGLSMVWRPLVLIVGGLLLIAYGNLPRRRS